MIGPDAMATKNMPKLTNFVSLCPFQVSNGEDNVQVREAKELCGRVVRGLDRSQASGWPNLAGGFV